MTVLLLRLAGPMQSWGTQSRFGIRDTGLEPSKSGVIGLICAALGRDRSESVDDLAQFKMGVRVDREGVVQRDYHTAMNVFQAGGGIKRTELSTRHFLADADFLVGLHGDDTALLDRIQVALDQPKWPLFLGRKSFPPACRIRVDNGLLEHADLLAALKAYPFSPSSTAANSNPTRRLRFVLETEFGVGPEVRQDQPHGPAFQSRSFLPRHVVTQFHDILISKPTP